jgi:hypothetical protein
LGTAISFPRILAGNGVAGNNAHFLLAALHGLSNPTETLLNCAIFAVSTCFLNSFLVLVTEPHWFRVWMFGDRVVKLQIRSLVVTCCIWTALILIGAFASLLVGQIGLHSRSLVPMSGGNDVAVFFVSNVAHYSPMLAVAFWLAGMAVLFSTSDAQAYSLVLLCSYDARRGQMRTAELSQVKPLLYCGLSAFIFASLYVFVRYFGIPLDKLVLLLLPFCLNIVPGLIGIVRSGAPQPALIWLSVGFYCCCALMSLAFDRSERAFAVAAPLMPMMISGVALLAKPGVIANAAART